MKWRTKRQLTILLIVLTPIIALIVLWWFLSRPEPNCFDGIMNQNEGGIDCGGVCENICLDQVPEPFTEWSRSFRESDSTYSAVASVRNGTDTFTAENTAYIFRLLDSEGVLVKEYKGRGYIPALDRFVVYVPSIEVGSREVSLTTFQFVEQPRFERAAPVAVRFGSERVESFELGTRVTSSIRLSSDETLEDIIVIAVLLDDAGTVFEASQTRIQELRPSVSEDIIFTWPEDLVNSIGSVEFYLSSYSVRGN